MLDQREESRPLNQQHQLVQAARKATMPFEASPHGRWVRFEGNEGVVYVVRDPWGDGCCVLSLRGEAGKTTTHFLSAEEAMREAILSVGGSADAVALHLDAIRAG